jgi:PAS domain S-box-containing protein
MPFRDGADGAESAALHARRLHVLFDRLPALIAYWDRDCRNVIANAAYLEWFGWTPEQMHGVHIREVLGPEVYTKNLPFITGALRGQEQLFERTLVDMSGRVRHTQASYVPDVLDGEDFGFFVLVTDVTPRVEAQQAMDEAQRLAKLGSWSMEVETGAIAWSDELYRIFEVDPESFVPTLDGLMERIDPRDVKDVLAQVERALADGADYDLTYRVHGAEGRLREVHSQGHPHTGPDGRVVRLTGTLQDVTAANSAARELSRANTELKKVNELNADVIAMLGHDVRAPLSVILGYLEELSDGWDEISDLQRRDHAERASRAAGRLRDLVDDILAMATVESGQIIAHGEEINALEHVRAAVDGVGRGLDVTVTAEGDPRAFADAFHVRQIVSNLVTNAVRHGEPPVAVHVECGEAATMTITVSDHGPGVAEDQEGSIFERFVVRGSGPQLTTRGTSTGFGLYIARGLADANHGSLTYEGTGDGARFCLSLPCTARHLEPGPASG